MTWQEELRALDGELADKGITPAEYRRRRDNLLAAASGGFPPAGQVAPQRPAQPTPPQGQPVQGHGQQGQPAQGGQPAADQGPDQRQPDQQPSDHVVVQYQPIQPMPSQPAPYQPPQQQSAQQQSTPYQPAQQPPIQQQPTQHQAAPPVQPMPHAAAPGVQPFTGVPSQPFTQPIQPMPSAQRQQQQQPDNHVVPPWSPVTELPMYQPLADQQAPAPQYAAPRAPMDDGGFGAQGAKKKSRAALLVVVVVVALLLLAGGWWFGLRPTMEAASAPPAPKALHLEDLPALPGTARLDRAELSVFEAQNRGLFDAREGDFLEADKVSQITFTGSADAKLNYAVFAFVADNTAGAKKVSSDLAEYQEIAGLQEATVADLPGQVKVLKLVTSKEVQYRAIYASGVNAVMVAIAQSQPADESSVAAATHSVITSMLTKAPVS